jgi:hypothetical protein
MKRIHRTQHATGLLLLMLLVASLGTGLPHVWAASGSVRLDARPDVLLADGHSTATIRAVVRDSAGLLVADGTLVRFTTTAGTITEVVPTSSGAARATLTSSSLPSVAEVSAYAESASASVKVQMVTSLADVSQAAPVVSVDGKYVAYSEGLRVLEAMDQAEARFEGLRIEANALQVDLASEYLRANGNVTVKGRDQTISGQRLLMNMRGLRLTLLGPRGRQVFQGRGLQELPSPQPAEAQGFDLADLSASEMLWTCDRATAVLGHKVQLRRATAYLIGARVLPLSFHEIRLDSGGADLQQYVGVGTEGLIVDLPYFVQLAPSGSTAFRLRHQYRSGFGWYSTEPGWQLDLERRYGVPGKAEGTINFGRITDRDWGMHWDHTHQFGPNTRLYTFFDYPAHRDVYGQVNFYKRLGFGSMTLNLSGNKLHNQSLARHTDVSLETHPIALSRTGVRLSLEGRLADSSGVHYEDFLGRRIEVPGDQSRELGLKLRPADLRLGKRTRVGSALSLREVWGSRSRDGLNVVGNANLSHGFGRGGHLSLNYSYNDFSGSQLFRSSGKHALSGTFSLGHGGRLRFTAFGMMGLDSPLRSVTTDLSYRLTSSWRLDFEQTMYRFRSFSDRDQQVGLARKLGDREVALFWSRNTHRFTLEVGASSF